MSSLVFPLTAVESRMLDVIGWQHCERELVDAAVLAVFDLPPQQQAAMMHRLNGANVADTAEAIGVTEQTAKNYRKVGRKTIRKALRLTGKPEPHPWTGNVWQDDELNQLFRAHSKRRNRQKNRDSGFVASERMCPGCGNTKPADAFYMSKNNGDGLSVRCKSCDLRDQRASKYGAEVADSVPYWQQACEVCLTTDPGARGWHIDHDHDCCSGKKSCGDCVRGLLCNNCNKALGHARDDSTVLQSMIRYVEAPPCSGYQHGPLQRDEAREWSKADQRRWEKFRIKPGDYAAMLKQQNDACAICRTTVAGGSGTWHVDHDHACCDSRTSCGECVRGLLCVACNTTEGMLKSDVQIMLNASNYLSHWQSMWLPLDLTI